MKKLEENGTRTTEMVTISRAEYEAQKAELTELKNQNDWLLEQLRLAWKKRFGASSEKVQEELVDQLRLTFSGGIYRASRDENDDCGGPRAAVAQIGGGPAGERADGDGGNQGCIHMYAVRRKTAFHFGGN